MFNSRRRCHRNLRISLHLRPVLHRTSWCTSFHSSNNWHCSSGSPHRMSLVWQTLKRWNRTPRNHSRKFGLARPPATNGSPSELWVQRRRNPRFEPYSVEFRYVVSETDNGREGRTKSIMVTVLLGLFVGVGWIKFPLPLNMASNSAVWRTSSILIVFGEPWNLQVSFLHSFFSLV